MVYNNNLLFEEILYYNLFIEKMKTFIEKVEGGKNERNTVS